MVVSSRIVPSAQTLLEAGIGSGCGSVGRAVASNTRGPRFVSSHWKTLYHLYTVNFIEKTKITKKMAGMAHLKDII